MRLGSKSRYLLELLAAMGLETIETAIGAPYFYKAVCCSSEKNLRRRAKTLSDKGWIVWDDSRESGKWVAKITRAGRSAINDNIDPEKLWDAPWDGNWHILSFDLPQDRSRERQALRAWLKKLRFGRLQGSVWITPRDLGDWELQIAKLKVDPTAVIFIKGGFKGASNTKDYVKRAWNFELINNHYKSYLNFLSEGKPQIVSADAFANWFREETALWRVALESDPLLPKELWPAGFAARYLGPKALKSRKTIYQNWKQELINSQ